MALQKIGKRAVWAKKSIDSIAFEYDLYVHIDGSTPISVEEKINSQFETPVSQTETWAKVSSGSIVDLDASDRAVLYSLVRNFEARTPHYRNTLRELSILAGEPQSGMNFSEDEKAMYAELRANPSLMSKFANELAYRTDWTAREFSSCGIAIWRVRRPVYVCTTPVHIMKVPAHPRLRASQMGLFLPHCFLMPLTSNAYVSLALGDFDGEFVNQEIDVNVELALKQQIVAQFAYWPIVNHMICDSGRIIDHLKWAGYNCTLDSPTKKVFVRDESFRVHQQVL